MPLPREARSTIQGMCSVGQNSTMSVGGDSPAGTMLAGSIGGGSGSGPAALTGRRRIGTLLGGQTQGPAAPTPGGRGTPGTRVPIQYF